MQKYIDKGEIDLLIPESKIKKTTFIEPKRFYDISQIVSKQEIKDSIVL